MGEGAHGDEVDAGGGDGGEVVEGDAAAGFGGCAAGVGAVDGFGQGIRGEVVEEDGACAGLEGFAEFVEGGDFDFDSGGGPGGAEGGADGVGEGAAAGADGGDVVVFDEDGGAEVVAVVGAAADADGVAFGEAEAGGGFAGVEDGGVRAGNLVHSITRHGGDAGEALEEVEGDALAAQDGVERALDVGDGRAGGEGDSIHDGGHPLDAGLDVVEGFEPELQAAEDAGGFGDEEAAAELVGGDGGVGGDVLGGAVFIEGGLDEAAHVEAVEWVNGDVRCHVGSDDR